FCTGIASDEELAGLVTDLAGHDLGALLDAFGACDAESGRPSVVFAYTVKGWGLPIAGHPRNHSALLTTQQIDEMRTGLGLTRDTEWDRFDPTSPEGILCHVRHEHLERHKGQHSLEIRVPDQTGVRTGRAVSTQEVFGRVLVDL